MTLPAQIARHLRDVYFGGNWTVSSYKEHLSDVTWEQATTKVHSLNTIATLFVHTSYYLGVAIKVLRGGPLEGSDKESFDLSAIRSQEDWGSRLEKTWADVETLAGLIEQMPEERIWENFGDSKYGNYYRNLTGTIEHAHYHLGQIVLVKKLIHEGVR
jgi:hypothetical protein